MVSNIIQLISESSTLHGYVTRQLWKYLRNYNEQQPLMQVAAWCIGEYGDLMISGDSVDDEPVQVQWDLKLNKT